MANVVAHIQEMQATGQCRSFRASNRSPVFGPSVPTRRARTQLRATQTAVTTAKSTAAKAPDSAPALLSDKQQASLAARYRNIAQHFPTALGVDDFIARVEIALAGFGFTSENSIAMTCLCRDEVTIPLKDKIESVFGSSFNTNGLGGVLTCGVTGMGAGFSHSPITNGKEHYVFFAFPHIGINSAGEIGAITRPGRPNKSCACGALQKALIELKAEGYSKNCKVPGVHDPLDPEYSILKQRLARRVRYEQLDPTKMSLVDITHVAERTITNDIEYLVEKTVDFKKANVAVITGVQIHNWATELSEESGIPSFEFVAPAKAFVVLDGKKYTIDLTRVPTSSPRQLQLFARASMNPDGMFYDNEVAIGSTVAGTLKEVPLQYLTQRLGVTKEPGTLDDEEGVEELAPWQHNIITQIAGTPRDPSAPTMDSMTAGERYTSFQINGGVAGFLGLSNMATPWPPSV